MDCRHALRSSQCAICTGLTEPYMTPETEGTVRVRYQVSMSEVARIVATPASKRPRPRPTRKFGEGTERRAPDPHHYNLHSVERRGSGKQPTLTGTLSDYIAIHGMPTAQEGRTVRFIDGTEVAL